MSENVHLLTGAYALNALDDRERAEFEAHLPTCDACSEEVREFQATATHLGQAATMTPPDALRERVFAEIRTVRQDAPVIAFRSKRRAAALTRLAVAASVVAMVGGLAFSTWHFQQRSNESAALNGALAAALAAPDTQTMSAAIGDGRGTLVVAPSSQRVMFIADDLPKAPHGHTYELWLISDTGAKPAGLFDARDDGTAIAMVDGTIEGAKALGVTVEPDGGSDAPTTQPIGAIDMTV